MRARTLKTVKILYVSQYYPPEMGAPAARVAELSNHWVRDGHEVTVLTGFPNHPTGVLHPEYREKLRRLHMQEVINGVNVVRTWLLPFPNGKAYERMLNYSSFCVSAACSGLSISRPDVVIATSPQLLVGLAGWWLAKWKRVPFIFEVRDLWPESLTAVGMARADSLLNRTLSNIAQFLYRRAHHVVIVSPAFEEHLVRLRNVPREKISTVENGVETDLFSPQAEYQELRNGLGDGRFVVCYIGTMGMAHGLSTLLDAAAVLQITRPEVLFLLVGEGSDKQRIRDLAASRGLNNIRLIDQQPRERIPAYIGASDACLVMLKKSELFKTVIPTKMLEFMACARPIILGVDGHARSIVETANAGIFVEPENAAQLADTIVELADNAALRENLGRNGRRHIQNHFSRERTAKLYINVIRAVLGDAMTRSAAA
ncbi:MAG TPA: glycosyltransferase family 4 protein [Terriglobales bacterium]